MTLADTAMLNGTLARLLRTQFPHVCEAIVSWLSSGPGDGWTSVGQPPPLVSLSGRLAHGRLDLVLTWSGATLLTDGDQLVAMLHGDLPETMALASVGRRLAELTGIPPTGNHDDELVAVIPSDGSGVTFLSFTGVSVEVDMFGTEDGFLAIAAGEAQGSTIG